ncbi:hypothetical protein [Acidicapsa ligni]|uniref:hypothetical protein n=1 Tax=Acidicapsa ligni TaxID=542300 RepID=UPI0021DF7595|nr:hypothetical protein [Acidicapsa ligni]
MATANPIPDTSQDLAHAPARTGASLLVLIASMTPEQLSALLDKLSQSLPVEDLLIATPDSLTFDTHPALRIIQAPATNASWTFTAADFVNAYQLAQKNEARAILMLGPESESLSSSGLFELANAVIADSIDLAMPHYDLPRNAGLVNSAILYPLTRALFAQRARFPLAIDLGLSLRMAERLAAAGQRFTASNQNNALIWPVDEAAVAGFAIQEFDVGPRTLPVPIEADLNSILALVAGSLFADVDAKAAFWQRTRTLPPARPAIAQPLSIEAATDIAPMLDTFRLAYTNLREIWSLVLPPNSLLGLKRLSIIDPAVFHMPESLWARIIFDFLLAYRLRTINRGHLLGALTPLYLAWAASHINVIASGVESERHIETVAAAFEADKPYLVSRWRWPDRFNP